MSSFIPYVIDNQNHRMAEVVSGILEMWTKTPVVKSNYAGEVRVVRV